MKEDGTETYNGIDYLEDENHRKIPIDVEQHMNGKRRGWELLLISCFPPGDSDKSKDLP